MGSIRASLIRYASPCLAAPLLVGCFAIADLDRFHGPRGSTSGGDITGYSNAVGEDLIVAFGEGAPEKLELRVLNSGERVVASTVVDSLEPSDREIVVPDLVPTDGAADRLEIVAVRGGAESSFRIALDRVSRTNGALRIDLADPSL